MFAEVTMREMVVQVRRDKEEALRLHQEQLERTRREQESQLER